MGKYISVFWCAYNFVSCIQNTAILFRKMFKYVSLVLSSMFLSVKNSLREKKVENVVITTWPPPKGAEKGTANSINCLWCVLKFVSELSKISVFARKKKYNSSIQKKKHNCDCYFDLLMFVLQKSYRLNINHMIWQIDTTSKIKIWLLSLKNI